MKRIIVGAAMLTVFSGSLQFIFSSPALATVRWVRARNGYIPPGAVRSDRNVFVCAYGDAIGKLNRGGDRCYVSYGGGEHSNQTYYVLVADRSQWIPLTGDIPGGAVSIPATNGERLYVCSAWLGDAWLSGKYLPSHDVCYVANGGREIGIRSFNVLVAE